MYQTKLITIYSISISQFNHLTPQRTPKQIDKTIILKHSCNLQQSAQNQLYSFYIAHCKLQNDSKKASPAYHIKNQTKSKFHQVCST